MHFKIETIYIWSWICFLEEILDITLQEIEDLVRNRLSSSLPVSLFHWNTFITNQLSTETSNLKILSLMIKVI